MIRKLIISIFFLISPIFSFPLILLELAIGSRLGYFLFSLFIAFFAYLYVPFKSADLYRYYSTFEYFQDIPLSELNSALTNRPDKGIYYLMKIYDTLGLNMQFLVFSVVLLEMSILIYIFRDIIKKYKVKLDIKKHILFFFLYFSSVGLINWYFTASRFFLSSTIVFYGYYLLYVQRKKIGIIFFFLAPLFHFSTYIFLLIALIPSNFFNKKILRLIFFITLIFHFIPKEIINGSINIGIKNIIPEENINRKFKTYTLKEDFIEKGLKNAENPILQYFFYYVKKLWFILAIFYFFSRKTQNIPQVLLLYFIILNFTAPFPTIYGRYATIVQMVFTLHLILESFKSRKITQYLYIYTTASIFSFLISIRSIRYQVFDIITSDSSLTLYSIFNKKIDTYYIESKWNR